MPTGVDPYSMAAETGTEEKGEVSNLSVRQSGGEVVAVSMLKKVLAEAA